MEQKKEKKTGLKILIGLGVVAAIGTAAYFIVQHSRNSAANGLIDTEVEDAVIPDNTNSNRTATRSSRTGFPLKRGSKGDLVRNVQQALISKYGVNILPRFGADGIWGSELENALISKGLPTTISADNFTQIVVSSPDSDSGGQPKKKKFRPELLAKSLRIAILDDDFDQALRSLSKIFTVKGYQKVNEEFKTKRIGGVRKTIVNGLLTKFSKPTEKKKLNSHFSRMGLKFDGRKWSLSGVRARLVASRFDQSRAIKTKLMASVWDNRGNSMFVEPDTILGDLIGVQNGIARFKTMDGNTLFTNTNSINYV